jgi:DNA-binding cell septation regulator SpoVG
MTGAIKILEWRQHKKDTLLGFAKVELPSGMVLLDVTILTGERGPWASPPSKPMIDREGAALKDAAGDLRYAPIIEFASREIRDRWSAAVIEAMRAAHPEVLT